MEIYIGIIALVIALAVLYLLYHFMKSIAPIVLNSIAGILVFLFLNWFFNLGIPINIWTVAIVGIGGFIGLVVVLFLHFFGIAF